MFYFSKGVIRYRKLEFIVGAVSLEALKQYRFDSGDFNQIIKGFFIKRMGTVQMKIKHSERKME